MSMAVHGRVDWNVTRDEEGHRDYKIKWLLVASSVTDGPAQALAAAGLPLIGSTWNFGGDSDAFAWCRPEATANPVLTNEPGYWWLLEQTFSTKPMKRCNDSTIEDPLDEPPEISGGFSKFIREQYIDRDGDPMVSSSWELFRGQAAEVDDPRPSISISMNSAAFNGAFAAEILKFYPLNDSPLWGFPALCVKFSNYTFRRQVYGTCNFYFTETYDFEVDYDTFDKEVLDEGSRVLMPGGNKYNPRHFILYKDPTGEPNRTLLDGNGRALKAGVAPVTKRLKKYGQSNLLLLGIPSSLA